MNLFAYILVLIAVLVVAAGALGVVTDLYLLSVIAFVVILALIVYKDRRNFERDSILLLRRTRFGRGFIKRTGERFPRFWKVLGTIGVFFGFSASIYIFYFSKYPTYIWK